MILYVDHVFYGNIYYASASRQYLINSQISELVDSKLVPVLCYDVGQSSLYYVFRETFL